MVRMVMILMFGIVAFGVSAAASWIVQNKVLAKPVVAEQDDGSLETPETAAENESQQAAGQTAAAPKPGEGGSSMPMPVRPRDMSVEELLRYGMSVKDRDAQVREREDQLQQRQVQQQIALADIEGERKEIDGLRLQVQDQLKTAEDLILKLNEARRQLLDDQQKASEKLSEIKEARVEIDSEHLDNTKKLSQWMQSMDPEKAAGVLKEMANDGNIDTAVQIIANFEEREAAKILSAIDDPKMIQEFVEKFRNLKKPQRTAANQ